jgi:hypothetical protein
MGRTDKKASSGKPSLKADSKSRSGKSGTGRATHKFGLVHSGGRRASKARLYITSTQQGADALNVAFMESVRDRVQRMALYRLHASGRIQVTAADIYACARDVRGMPQFV